VRGTAFSFRHSRESGNPGRATRPGALDSRFRGNDERGRGTTSWLDPLSPVPGARGEGQRVEGVLFPAVRPASAGNLQVKLRVLFPPDGEEVPLTPALSPVPGARGEVGAEGRFPAALAAFAANLQRNLATTFKPTPYTQKAFLSNGFSVISAEGKTPTHSHFFPRPLQADPEIGLRFEGGGPGWGWPNP